MKWYRVIGCCVILATATIAGCSKTSKTPTMVGEAQIIVLPGSRLVDTNQFEGLEGVVGNLGQHTTKSWSFKTDATAQEIMEYYVSKYPKLESTLAENEVVKGHFDLEWLTGGVDSIEGIGLWIQDGEFEIGETIRN